MFTKATSIVCALILLAGAFSRRADADVMTASLGNVSPFADGYFPSLLLEVGPAQAGQPVPFDQGYGFDPGLDFNVNWVFNYAAPTGPITAASITVGMLDHDSASPGSQLASFDVDGTDVTGALDVAFEAHGGANNEYNEYTIILPGSAFAAPADGTAPVALALQGPVLTPPLFGGDPVQEPNNGAHIFFSTLQITFVPEPATLGLLLLGGLALLRRRR